MSKAGFRITSIAFDDAEEVKSATAIASGASLAFVRAHALEAQIADGDPAQVTLPAAVIVRLHREAGRLTGTHPEHEGSHPVYNSLCWVIYGLIED